MVGGGGGGLKVAWFSLKEVSLPPLLEGRETPKPKFGGKMSEKFWYFVEGIHHRFVCRNDVYVPHCDEESCDYGFWVDPEENPWRFI